MSALVEAVAAVEDEQRYVWARERAARDLNEATNTSVARWSLLELATMVAVGLAQAWAMKNYFETKVRAEGGRGRSAARPSSPLRAAPARCVAVTTRLAPSRPQNRY